MPITVRVRQLGGYRETEDIDTWDLPLIVWFNDAYRNQFPETVQACRRAAQTPLQPDQLFCGFLHFAQIETNLALEEDFLNEKFRPRAQRMVDGERMDYANIVVGQKGE